MRVIVALVSLAAALLSATEAAAMVGGPAVNGIVTDKTGGKPIAGAQVLVLWSGTLRGSVHSTSGGCYQVLNATTDAAGRFSVPSWRKDLPGVAVADYNIHVYARGYQETAGERTGRDVGGMLSYGGRVASGGNKITVSRFDGSVKDRLMVLAFLRNNARCAEAGASRRNAVDFYRSMNEELVELAATPEGQAIAAAEKPEIARRKLLGLPLLTPPLVVDLAPAIADLQSARDGELYGPARATAAPSAPSTPAAPASR